MKNKLYNGRISTKYVVGFIIILGLEMMLNNFIKPYLKKNNMSAFEQQMAASLNLRHISSNSLYDSSWLKIFGDTVVGYHADYNDPDSCYFFIQSLKNLLFIKHISAKQLVQPCKDCGLCASCIWHIDDYQNGCIYTAEYGRDRMLKISLDGKIAQYFGSYSNELFHANKILLYQQKAVITSYSGIFIFDIPSQKLLWEFKYDLNNGLSAIAGSKLVFAYADEKDIQHLRTFLVGVDLDKLKESWTLIFQGNYSGLGNSTDIGQPYHELEHTTSEIRFSSDLGLSVIDANTGHIKQNYKFIGSNYILDSTCLYASNQALKCYNLKTGAQIWKVDDIDIIGEYKSSIIAKTVDEKFYIVVDKLTGKVKARIKNPDIKSIPMMFIGGYVLFNRKDLYR